MSSLNVGWKVWGCGEGVTGASVISSRKSKLQSLQVWKKYLQSCTKDSPWNTLLIVARLKNIALGETIQTVNSSVALNPAVAM